MVNTYKELKISDDLHIYKIGSLGLDKVGNMEYWKRVGKAWKCIEEDYCGCEWEDVQSYMEYIKEEI